VGGDVGRGLGAGDFAGLVKVAGARSVDDPTDIDGAIGVRSDGNGT
jgi:hypothetical protein